MIEYSEMFYIHARKFSNSRVSFHPSFLKRTTFHHTRKERACEDGDSNIARRTWRNNPRGTKIAGEF